MGLRRLPIGREQGEEGREVDRLGVPIGRDEVPDGVRRDSRSSLLVEAEGHADKGLRDNRGERGHHEPGIR